MIYYKTISSCAVAGLLLLGACSDKTDKGGNATATADAALTPAAAAARMPKGGLWEMTVTAAGMPNPMTMRTCLADPAPGSNPFAPPAQPGQACAKNKITPTATGYTIDMECAANNVTMAIAGTVSGDFSTSFRTDLTTKMTGANIPAAAQQGVKSSVEAKYVGACPADMKPGETKQGA